MQTINVPEKITRFFCGADLYSCVRWSTDKIFHIFREHSGRDKGSPLLILFKICVFNSSQDFAGFC